MCKCSRGPTEYQHYSIAHCWTNTLLFTNSTMRLASHFSTLCSVYSVSTEAPFYSPLYSQCVYIGGSRKNLVICLLTAIDSDWEKLIHKTLLTKDRGWWRMEHFPIFNWFSSLSKFNFERHCLCWIQRYAEHVQGKDVERENISACAIHSLTGNVKRG